VQAYSPLEAADSDFLDHRVLADVARRHAATPAQVALAWLYQEPGIVPIPNSSNVARTCENAACINLELSEGERNELQAAFARPTSASGLPIR
jgi:diketogulonate reductase-like aldo/keto reductase